MEKITRERVEGHIENLVTAAGIVDGELATLRLSDPGPTGCHGGLDESFEETSKALRARAAKLRQLLDNPAALAGVQVVSVAQAHLVTPGAPPPAPHPCGDPNCR